MAKKSPEESATASCRCGRRWSGTTQAHCSVAGCHRHFSSVAAFDRHRAYDVCFDPTILKRKDGKPAFAQHQSVYGETWSLFSDAPAPAHWAKT